MKEKAKNNLLAAKNLIGTHTLSTESVHCSYYAVYQYMMYMLNTTERNPISYEDQKQRARGMDSHTFILQEIKIRMNCNASSIKAFYDAVVDLKNARVTADYTTTPIPEIDSLRYKAQAESLISKLKQYFGNI